MDKSELLLLQEEALAPLLGVSARMVRNYIADRGLPHVGIGKHRRFVWSLVLEWYIAYRVEIALRGGKQKGDLGRKLAEIKSSAGLAVREEMRERNARHLQRERVFRSQLTQEVRELKRQVPGRRLIRRPRGLGRMQ